MLLLVDIMVYGTLIAFFLFLILAPIALTAFILSFVLAFINWIIQAFADKV